MSTKCSIAYGDKFHLYEEIGDTNSIWLQIDDASDARVRVHDNHKSDVRVAIDIKVWRQIVEGWLASTWARDDSLDYKRDTFDYSSTMEWLEKISKTKPNTDPEEK